MATNTTSSAKTHVSLRLPTSILESIDAHAEKEHISRTEAFVYYLQTGLEISDAQANEPSKDEVRSRASRMISRSSKRSCKLSLVLRLPLIPTPFLQ